MSPIVVMMLVVVSPLTGRATNATVALPHAPHSVEECMTEAEQFLRENPEVIPAGAYGFYSCGPYD